jgi:hypothetical protein
MSQSAHPMLGARRDQMFPTMTQADIRLVSGMAVKAGYKYAAS